MIEKKISQANVKGNVKYRNKAHVLCGPKWGYVAKAPLCLCSEIKNHQSKTNTQTKI